MSKRLIYGKGRGSGFVVSCTFSKSNKTLLAEFVIAGALVRKEEDLLKIYSMGSESRSGNTLGRVQNHKR